MDSALITVPVNHRLIGNAMTVTLPSFSDIDISAWQDVSPAELLRDPSLFPEMFDQFDVARALKYARAGKTNTYDEIGFRASAVAREKGFAPLTTLVNLEMDRATRIDSDPLIEAISREEQYLGHRPIDLPLDERKIRYTGFSDKLRFIREGSHLADAPAEEVWDFSLSYPPQFVLTKATKFDIGPVTAQGIHGHRIPGGRWIPLSLLVEAGGFQPFQAWQHKLTTDTLPGNFYCLLSHRWTASHHPDPSGIKAATFAWHMVYQLCDAVRIAATRGLWEPRLFNEDFRRPIGVFGSDIAESLLVNVLRAVGHEKFLLEYHEHQTVESAQLGMTIISNVGDLLLQKGLLESSTDDGWLGQAVGEVEAIQPLTEDSAETAAIEDLNLQRLEQFLWRSPTLCNLLSRIQCWYDYGCLPQTPRTQAEDELLSTALANLEDIQMVGRTIALIDDPVAYLSRAWCTLELLAAEGFGRGIDTIGVSPIRSNDAISIHRTHLWDRQHIIWRALLDTELFRVQTFQECMYRLRLYVNVTSDLDSIYSRLLALGPPEKMSFDPSEILTGVFPLPTNDDGDSIVWAKQWPAQSFAKTPGVLCSTISLQGAFKFGEWNDGDLERKRNLPPIGLIHRPTSRNGGDRETPSCHVAVIGCCEGEALMLANWVQNHIGEIETLLGTRVVSFSWLAVDAAPVGHFQNGRLSAFPIQAETWVVIAHSLRFKDCRTTKLLCALAKRQARTVACVAFDDASQNVMIHRDTMHPESRSGNGWWASAKRYMAACWNRLGFKLSHTSPSEPHKNSEEFCIIGIPRKESAWPIHFGGLYRGSLLTHLLAWPRVNTAIPSNEVATSMSSEAHLQVADAAADAAAENTSPKSLPTDFVDVFELLVTERRVRATEAWQMLCNEHVNTIIDNFSEWKNHVATLGGDPPARNERSQTLCAISQTLDTEQHPTLASAIVEGDEIVLTEVYRVYESGMYFDSVAMLLPIIAGLERVGGSTRDEWLGKMFGMLGLSYFRIHDWNRAKEFTQRALTECERTHDEAGVNAYRANLRMICSADPSSDSAICRKFIAQAQQLSDSGWFDKSNKVLLEVLQKLESTADLREYRPKTFGLLGSNWFRLQDFSQAEHFTSQALQEAMQQRDAAAMMIYKANLDAISRGAGLEVASEIGK